MSYLREILTVIRLVEFVRTVRMRGKVVVEDMCIVALILMSLALGRSLQGQAYVRKNVFQTILFISA
jgi:hypothetical protein